MSDQNAKTRQPDFSIRPATPRDVTDILTFIKELADYEHMLDQVVATEALLLESLFGEKPEAAVLLANVAGNNIGFALYHSMYSTFIARSGIYLEDLYVQPNHRGRGYGKALLAHLAMIAVEGNHCRLDWSCLKWNEPSLAFYRSIGAVEMEDWTRLRMQGKELAALAALAHQ